MCDVIALEGMKRSPVKLVRHRLLLRGCWMKQEKRGTGTLHCIFMYLYNFTTNLECYKYPVTVVIV